MAGQRLGQQSANSEAGRDRRHVESTPDQTRGLAAFAAREPHRHCLGRHRARQASPCLRPLLVQLGELLLGITRWNRAPACAGTGAGVTAGATCQGHLATARRCPATLQAGHRCADPQGVPRLERTRSSTAGRERTTVMSDLQEGRSLSDSGHPAHFPRSLRRRLFSSRWPMSALPPIADIRRLYCDVR